MSELVFPLVFFVALAYSAVGHGGASGYLAVLSLWGFAPRELAPTALTLNIVVAGISFVAYRRAGYFVPRLLWPFAAGSVPAALLGGLCPAPPRLCSWLLAGALSLAAWRLFARPGTMGDEHAPRPVAMPSLAVALPVGAGIGLISGIVGVGGGVFLSPLLILAGWADPKSAAGASAGFIVLNSISGLYGHLSRPGWAFPGPDPWGLLACALAGGICGSWLGTRRFNGLVLRRVLSGGLVLSAIKLLRLALV